MEPPILIFLLVSDQDDVLTTRNLYQCPTAFPCDRRCSFPKISSIIDVREVFFRYSPNEMNNRTKTSKYRCTGAHSTKKCAMGVVEAIDVSNIINYIEINKQNPYSEL